MPIFHIHLRRGEVVEPDEIGLHFRDLHHAYLETCKTIPDIACEELVAGRDPINCSFQICDAGGRRLMNVPFSELLSPAEWRFPRARRRPHGGARSAEARNRLALDSFRQMFGALNVGCVLMTPELEVVEMNAFGAAHSHVDPEAIQGTSILDIFALSGQPKEDFERFMRTAQAGAVSEIIDMPYLVLDRDGATADGWWNARTWPLFDDDGHLLGLVEWAEPFLEPTNRGRTLLRVAPGLAR